jgi:hypothetical protein
MSVINSLREKRDPWFARFEEHRLVDEDEGEEALDRESENERIKKRRAMVGVFPKREEADKR